MRLQEQLESLTEENNQMKMDFQENVEMVTFNRTFCCLFLFILHH